jgi:DNA mismatch repair protein MutS
MSFESILFERPDDRPAKKPSMPAFFMDLNLDQIIEAVVGQKEEYNLKPFFWSPLTRIGAIEYRHEVMQELEREEPARIIGSFAQGMHIMRDYLARRDRLFYPLQKQRWFIDAVDVYCGAVGTLSREIWGADLKSRGFLAFREYLKAYTDSDAFASLVKDTTELKADLDNVNYCIHVRGKTVTVRRCESEEDFSADVEKTFERFKQGDTRDYRASFVEQAELNDLEVRIVEAVSNLYPDEFDALDTYCKRHEDFLNTTVVAFDREVQFYVSYLEFIESIKAAGLEFCYPKVSDTSKEISEVDGFDLALANKLVAEDMPIVCNDFFMKGRERIFVVSGPNQGGKTTFARTFGQLHYLASLGCPVAGKEARLFLFDSMFTHFEKEETTEDLKSKLEDDLMRIRDIFDGATSRSIVIANEILTSTTLNDAVYLGKKVMERLIELDLLCVWVTFVEELASYSEKTVSMISMVTPENPALRTYKVLRRPAHGLSYAAALSEKYGLTYESLKERIKQ